MIKLFIYTQRVTDARDPKNVKTWDKYKASYQKHTFDIILTKDLHNRLDYELKQEKLVMPILMTLDDTQYFTKKRHYLTGAKLKLNMIKCFYSRKAFTYILHGYDYFLFAHILAFLSLDLL